MRGTTNKRRIKIMYINSKEKDGFELKLYFEPEYSPIDWDFESEDQERELHDKIESGELLYFCAKVTASKNGIELGVDYLGGCVFEGETDFMDSDGYYNYMCEQAISEAKTAIKLLTA